MNHIVNPLSVKVVAFAEEAAVIQAIRRSVFQIEQGVDAALDFDGLDQSADHLVAYYGDEPAGTARIRYVGGHLAKIERLAVLPAFRRQGIGKKMMQTALEMLAQKKVEIVQLHAQVYVQELYEQLGFERVGAGFVEAGIAHIKMQKHLSQS